MVFVKSKTRSVVVKAEPGTAKRKSPLRSRKEHAPVLREMRFEAAFPRWLEAGDCSPAVNAIAGHWLDTNPGATRNDFFHGVAQCYARLSAADRTKLQRQNMDRRVEFCSG